MSLSESALQELNKILEKEYGITLDLPLESHLLNKLGESLLNLFSAAIKARSRASRLGFNIPPSCLEERCPQDKQQQLFPLEECNDNEPNSD